MTDTTNLPAPKQDAVPAAPMATTIFQVIERAAKDPSVDIDKMERLIAMQERMQAKAAELDFDNAMADAQSRMSAVRADASNPQTRSKYASYYTLDQAIRPVYTDHGFSLSFDTGDGAPDGCVRVVCKVAHRGGHRERHHIDMPSDGKGAKGGDVMTKTHAMGSAVTYGKRYLLGMIFNVAIGGDDDGNAAGGYRKRDVDGPGSSWGPQGRQGAVDEAERDGLTRGAPLVTAAKRAIFEKWHKNALGTLKLSGQTADSLDTLWDSPDWTLKRETLEKYAPDLFATLKQTYETARENASALAA